MLSAWIPHAAWLSPPPTPRTRAIRASAESVTVSTFNLWCPEYRRLGDEGTRESSFPEMYTQRQQRLLELPLWQESDIVCCQEFWYASPDVFEMYVSALRRRFKMHGLQRSGRRPDGLLMAIAHEWEVIHEEDLDFDDIAGRCAQVLHVRRDGRDPARTAVAAREENAATLNPSNVQIEAEAEDECAVDVADGAGGAGGAGCVDTEVNELLVANVHLMFQHNDEVARVRLREMYKVLSALDRYKATLAAPPPTLICGDFNGPIGSVVAECLARYGWRDSYSESSGCDVFSEEECGGWVSHLNHLGQVEGVDYIMVQSPSVPRRPAPCYTDFVIQEIAQALLADGYEDPIAAWRRFSRMARDKVWDVQGVVEDDDSVDSEGFKRALRQLGFGAAPLTQREVDAVVASCDVDGNGSIDAAEWRTRFAAAVERLQGTVPLIQDQEDSRADLECIDSHLMPECLERGKWPDEEEWGLSDHGVVTSTFVAQRRGEAEVTAWIEQRSRAEKAATSDA